MFGEGTMDFPPICRALGEIGYSGGVHVELSRHSHKGAEAVRAAAAFLKPLITGNAHRSLKESFFALSYVDAEVQPS